MGKAFAFYHFSVSLQKSLILHIFESFINWLLHGDITYITPKQLQYKCGHAAIDSN